MRVYKGFIFILIFSIFLFMMMNFAAGHRTAGSKSPGRPAWAPMLRPPSRQELPSRKAVPPGGSEMLREKVSGGWPR